MRLVIPSECWISAETGERQYRYECMACGRSWLGNGKSKFWRIIFGQIPAGSLVPDGWEIYDGSEANPEISTF